jgi:hypothetical protein
MYSQAGQDDWIMSLIDKGYFVDIGAHDGHEFSNTLALEERGWAGLCIEPLAYPERTCSIAHVAVETYTGIAYMVDAGMGSYVDSSGIEVPCDTLGNLFKKYNVPKVIDYVSLDIEGMEGKILETWPEEYSFRFMTVEHNLYKAGPENKGRIFAALTLLGCVRLKEDVLCTGLPFEDWYGQP